MQLARGQVGALALQTAPRQGPGRHTSASDGTHLRHALKYLCIPCPALPRSSLSNIEDPWTTSPRIATRTPAFARNWGCC
jgi:hypothetical protein